MIYYFYGTDRAAIDRAIHQTLGDDYEALAGEKIAPGDLPNLFLGTSLFAKTRKLVVRGLLDSGVKLSDLTNFLATPHTIILVETSFDRRTAAAKELLESPKFQAREFKLPEKDTRAVFDILTTARRDGPRAVALLDSIIDTQDPHRFAGLLATQAVKAYATQPTPQNQAILKSLAELDLQLKTSPLSGEPWLLIKSWLLQVSQL